MATVSKKSKLKPSPKQPIVSVPITPRLQIAFVTLLTLSYAALVGPSLYYMVKYQSTPAAGEGVQYLSMAIPLLLFIVAFFYVGKLPTALARLFKATFLALLGLFLYVAAQMLVSFLPFLQPQGGNDWQASYTRQQVIVNVATLALFGGVLAYVKWQRKARRG